MDEMPKLPEDAEELMGFSDLNPAWMTINRTPDGTVYVVSWWYGSSKVVAVVNPDGSSQKADEY
jgi:hypothetical protein